MTTPVMLQASRRLEILDTDHMNQAAYGIAIIPWIGDRNPALADRDAFRVPHLVHLAAGEMHGKGLKGLVADGCEHGFDVHDKTSAGEEGIKTAVATRWR